MSPNLNNSLSVLMPVRNCSDYLEQALSSVLRQSLSGFKVLVIDDDSTDNTRDIVRSAAERDPRVRLLKNPGNGISDALNYALSQSNEEFVARMDGDDVCLPNRFKSQLIYLLKHADIAAVGTQVEWIDETGNPKGRGRYPTDWRNCEAFLKIGSPFCHPSMMLRREAVIKAGGYRKEFDGAEDIDLWLRMSRDNRLANIDAIHLQYRVHANNFSGQWKENTVARLLSARIVASFPQFSRYLPAGDDLSVDMLFEYEPLTPVRAFVLFHLFAYMALGNKPNPKYLQLLEEYTKMVKSSKLMQNRLIETFWMMRLVRSCWRHGMTENSRSLLQFLLLNRVSYMAREFLLSIHNGANRNWFEYEPIEPEIKQFFDH